MTRKGEMELPTSYILRAVPGYDKDKPLTRDIGCWSIFAAIKSTLLAENTYDKFTVLEYLFCATANFHVAIKRANCHF